MIGLISRSVGSIVASLVVALVLIIAMEGVSAIFHPFPPGVDTSDLEVCKAHVAKYPNWLLALFAPGWGLTTFVSSWLATRLGAGRHPAHGIAIGSFLLLAAAFNMFMLPYPIWFEILNFVIIPVGIYYGAILGRGRPPKERGDDADAESDIVNENSSLPH